MKVHVKNVSDSVAFFAPLNRNLRPHEIVDVLAACEGNGEMAVRLVASYERHPQFQVFKVLDVKPSPEGILQLDNGGEYDSPPIQRKKKEKRFE